MQHTVQRLIADIVTVWFDESAKEFHTLLTADDVKFTHVQFQMQVFF
jgi:hypothetical protein